MTASVLCLLSSSSPHFRVLNAIKKFVPRIARELLHDKRFEFPDVKNDAPAPDEEAVTLEFQSAQRALAVADHMAVPQEYVPLRSYVMDRSHFRQAMNKFVTGREKLRTTKKGLAQLKTRTAHEAEDRNAVKEQSEAWRTQKSKQRDGMQGDAEQAFWDEQNAPVAEEGPSGAVYQEKGDSSDGIEDVVGGKVGHVQMGSQKQLLGDVADGMKKERSERTQEEMGLK